MINDNPITINYLKDLYFKRFGGHFFIKKPVEILVTLTPEQFGELNDDLMKSTTPLLLLIEESEYKQQEPGSVLYTRISVQNICEFVIEIGYEFEFELLDKSLEHGDETL